MLGRAVDQHLYHIHHKREEKKEEEEKDEPLALFPPSCGVATRTELSPRAALQSPIGSPNSHHHTRALHTVQPSTRAIIVIMER